MTHRIHAARVIASRRIFETFISPGFYIAQCIGLLCAYLLITAFAGSIDSSGFNSSLSQIYEFISRSLTGAFGTTFVTKLFSEGPFLFSLYVSFIPVIIFLGLSSVFRFGLEKNVGAVELVVYGPADGTSYFIASVVKDMFFVLIHLVFTLIVFSIAALTNNLSLGPRFFQALISLFFLSFAIFSYGILSSVVTESAASAIALFAAAIVFFIFIQLGSYSIVSVYVRNLSTVLSWIVKWMSPFFYGNLGAGALDYGNTGLFILSLFLLVLLSSVLLYVSHLVMRSRGVRK
jgi:hypothetical protein